MMMIIRRCVLILLIILSGRVLSAQESDFGIWAEINTEIALSKSLEADLSLDARTFDNSSRLEEGFVETGLKYKPFRSFSVSGYYRLTKKLEDNMSYYYRHKVYIDLKASHSLGDLTMSARLRFQRSSKTYIEDDGDLIPAYYGRVKVKSEYDIPSFPVTPYGYIETFTPMFSGDGFTIDKFRVSAGAEIKVNSFSSVAAGYILQKEAGRKSDRTHILSIGYNLKF